MSKVINFAKTKQILCEYHNRTSHLQLVRLLNNSRGFERVISPGTKYQFIAVPEAYLEVTDFSTITSLMDSPIYCHELAISENKLEPIAA